MDNCWQDWSFHLHLKVSLPPWCFWLVTKGCRMVNGNREMKLPTIFHYSEVAKTQQRHLCWAVSCPKGQVKCRAPTVSTVLCYHVGHSSGVCYRVLRIALPFVSWTLNVTSSSYNCCLSLEYWINEIRVTDILISLKIILPEPQYKLFWAGMLDLLIMEVKRPV
jgi:hypothetical protein